MDVSKCPPAAIQGFAEQRLGVIVLPLVPEGDGEVVQGLPGVGMIAAKYLATNGQCVPLMTLGGCVVALFGGQYAEVIDVGRDVRMIRTKDPPMHLESFLEGFFS